MKDRSPCISCHHRYPGCQSKCQIGLAYFKRIREQKDAIRTERDREIRATGFVVDRIMAGKR